MKFYHLLLSASLSIFLTGCGGEGSGANPAATPVPGSSAHSSTSTTTSAASSSSMPSSSVVSSSSTASVITPCATQECEAQNKALVTTIYTEVMNNNRVDLIENLFDVNVILHIAGANNGSTGETAHLQTLKNKNPSYQATLKHLAADGDYVAVHWHLSASPSDEFSGIAVVDLYKLAGNKIVEHWFLMANLWSPTASGNSLFSDLYVYPATKPLATQASEAANKDLVTSVYLGLFNDKNLDLVDQYIDPGYIQHNPFVQSGREPFRSFVSSRTPGGLSFFATLADDDLVWTFSGNGNLSLMDIFRVDAGKIVEHYDLF